MPDKAKITDALPLLLLVEDSQTTTVLLTKYLSGSYRLVHAKDGVQAWEILEKNPEISLVITDINMPRLDGIGLIKEARKLLRFTPILALTTESQQSKRDEAKKNGATGWLVKPFGGAELEKLIKQVVPGA